MFRLVHLINGIRRTSVVAAMGLALGSMACGGDAAGPSGDVDVVGWHDMVTIDTYNVPHTFTDAAGSKLTVNGGTLILYDDGWYELTYAGKLNAIEFDLSDSGTYTLTGSTLNFESEYDEVYSGTLSGSNITVPRKIAGVMFTMGFSVE